MKHALPVLLLALVCCASPLAAQDLDDPIATDRPGLGTGTSVVQPGRVQVEVGTPGVAYLHGTAIGQRPSGPFEVDVDNWRINFPTLLRAGLLPWLEVRLSSTIYNFTEVEVTDRAGGFGLEGSAEGFGGLNVGAKARLLRGSGATPTLSLVPTVTLPVGEGQFASDRTGYTADLVAGWDLADGAGLTLIPGTRLDPVSDIDDFIFTFTTTGVVSGSLTDRLGSYVEGQYFVTDGEFHGGYAGAGLTYLVSPTAQLDFFFDSGIGEEAADWRFGGGVSIRFGD